MSFSLLYLFAQIVEDIFGRDCLESGTHSKPLFFVSVSSLSVSLSVIYVNFSIRSLNVCFVLSIASSSFPRQCLHKLEHWRSPYENDAIESSYVWKNKNCNCLLFSICVSISIFVAAFVCVSVSVSVSLSVSFFLLSSLSDCPQLSIASRHVSE